MTARYDGPVVDAHHHFWQPRLGHQPWLRPGASIPFRYGDYEAIKRDYLPPDLLRDAASACTRLVGSVTMETEWDEDDLLGEVVWTEGVAAEHGLPSAVVARALLHHDDVEAALAALAERPLVRAVRHKPGQAGSPAAAASTPTLLSDPAWRRGFAALARHGFAFELQTAWWHLAEAAELFSRHPEVPVVLNHAGLPADRSAPALEGWRAAVRGIARLPHVSVKISGLGLPGVAWTADVQRPVVEALVEAFGADRVMFASNFPVDSLTATYEEVYGSFLEISAGWSRDEQRAAFAGTAVRTYRLPPALLEGA